MGSRWVVLSWVTASVDGLLQRTIPSFELGKLGFVRPVIHKAIGRAPRYPGENLPAAMSSRNDPIDRRSITHVLELGVGVFTMQHVWEANSESAADSGRWGGFLLLVRASTVIATAPRLSNERESREMV